MVAEVAYVGSHGFNLAFPVDLNQVPQSRLGAGGFAIPAVSDLSGYYRASTRNNAISNYNSLQASITKRYDQRRESQLQLRLVALCWTIWTPPDGEAARVRRTTRIATNPAANYSNSNFDVRHAFKGYAVYQLPFGRGKQIPEQQRRSG